MFEEFAGKNCKIVLNAILGMSNSFMNTPIIYGKIVSENDYFVEIIVLKAVWENSKAFGKNERVFLNKNNVLAISVVD